MTDKTDNRAPLVEIAVQDPTGAQIAVRNGADRLELCVALSTTGGLTPSIGLVEAVCEAVKEATRESAVTQERTHRLPPVAVLVRPREGNFVYSAAERAVMERDIRAVVAVSGVGAVVIGALTEAGDVDVAAMRGFIEAAGRAEVVFHRAIDAAADPLAALKVVRELGCARVLTSGGALAAPEGEQTLARMVAEAEGAVEIMAGGGVRSDAIAALVATGVDAIHLSAKASQRSAPVGPGGGEDYIAVTDAALVKASVDATHAGWLARRQALVTERV